MIAPTAVDRFWANAQMQLLPFPRPEHVLEALREVDPDLHRRLSEGEQFLMRETNLERLTVAWEQWFNLMLRGLALLRARGVRVQSP
jgi:hypothetical protein